MQPTARSKFKRREALKIIGMGLSSLSWPLSFATCRSKHTKKTHIVTLSFDDGFKKSSLKTAEIYEKYGLAACINVIASAHLKNFDLPNEYHKWPVGDFDLWNELQQRGHEIMPHGYMHANLSQISFEKAKDLIRRCLDVFSKELKGFDPQDSVFNFPYNASTSELEEWLPTQVRAFRTRGDAINKLPYKEVVKLTCTSYGPENIDEDLKSKVDELLSKPSGWLIYNTHGLDDESWGPMSSNFLDELLKNLSAMDSVAVLPAGKVLSNLV
jgi:peptidoglycan/xylan/chitin deacetylase (PgdA/CDA1 family)